MMRRLRPALILLGLVLVLGAANAIILDKERTVRSARLVLLELRPVDPRALLQGDYMQLDFADSVALPPEGASLPPGGGAAVMALDQSGIARLVRLDDGTALAADEALMRFAGPTPEGRLDFGTDAFFFQEGDAELYADARYGMFRVDVDGNSVLVGLADGNARQIGRESE